MPLTGQNHVASRRSADGDRTFRAIDPVNGRELEPVHVEATGDEIDSACAAAAEAFEANRRRPAADRADLLEAIADRIESLEDELVARVTAETGLPAGRVAGERGRTTGQLRLFADLVREGSWVDARIDRARPDRAPAPKPDLRRMLVPIGAVAVFGASNFPLAFSTAGGDTASALAAGCPVVCKGHPAHPGTSELVATAIDGAVADCGFHPGTFSHVQGAGSEVGLALATHPAIAAVGFTGSLRAGRALFDAAAARPRPIPVFAEMGSVNPVFVLPGALQARSDEIAAGLVASLTMGAGQFCTSPGLVFGLRSDALGRFARAVAARVQACPAFTLLHGGIRSAFEAGVDRFASTDGVRSLGTATADADSATPARAVVLMTDAATFAGNPHLHEEVFGPVTLLVEARSPGEMVGAARALGGNLTASIHGDERDLAGYAALVGALETRVGRLVFNGFPTGVEVCPSMTHGGPYPATTDARWTSVGTAAILRFVRPMTWQDFPEGRLPPELRDANPLGIRRLIDGVSSTGPV